MKLNVAIQMDHVSTIDIDGDSTFVLGLEAERRGYAVWHYTPPELIFRDRKVLARAQPMKLRREKGNHFTLGAPEIVDLVAYMLVSVDTQGRIRRETKKVYTMLLFGMINYTYTWYDPTGRVSPQQFSRMATDVFLDGFLAALPAVAATPRRARR